jgi:hypothetical protein
VGLDRDLVSLQAMTAVMEGSRLTSTAYLVLLVIANHEGDKDGEPWAWPSIDRLRREARCSDRTVIRAIQQAELAGELRIERGAGPNGVHLYRVLLGKRGDSLTSPIRPTDTQGPSVSPKHKEQGSSSSVSSSSSHPNVSPIRRPDVERLCELLADLIADNGVKRPTVTEAWRREMRLLIDRDGYPGEVVERVIRFVQADEFERANVLGVPKLRKRFAALKLKAERGDRSSTPKDDDSLEARVARGRAQGVR